MELTPPICAWIRETRERLRDEAQATGGREAAAEFSQEAVARRVGVTISAYRAYEVNREPRYARRQQIARALGLAENFFETARSEDERFRQIREEIADVREAVRRLEDQSQEPPQAAEESD